MQLLKEHVLSASVVYIHADPLMQAKFATKCACTPYYQDPAYGAYRSVLPEDILSLSRADMDILYRRWICRRLVKY